VSQSSISPGSLLDSPLASTLTTSTNQAVSTGARLNSGSSAGASTASAAPDPLTQDLVTLLKALAYGDVAGAKSDLAKYKADLKAQTTAAAASNTNYVATLSNGLTSANAAQTGNVSDTLVANISASLNSGSVLGALHDLSGYLVRQGQASGGLINTLG
jgi:hypothetical protein